MVDPDEKAAMRIQSARLRKKRHRKVEKLQVDPQWFKDFVNKRKRTGESEGEEQTITGLDVETEKELEKMIGEGDNSEIKKSVLLDYLEHINKLRGKMKIKMYEILLKLLHITNFEHYKIDERPRN